MPRKYAEPSAQIKSKVPGLNFIFAIDILRGVTNLDIQKSIEVAESSSRYG